MSYILDLNVGPPLIRYTSKFVFAMYLMAESTYVSSNSKN